LSKALGETGRRIMLAALRELSAGGYSSVSMQKVAKAAGVTKPTVYYHFHSKEGLFHAMLVHAMDGVEELVRREMVSSGSTREGVENLLRSVLRPPGRPDADIASVSLAFSSDPGLLRMFPWMSERLASLVDLLAGTLAQARARGEIRPGVNVRLAAKMLISTVRMCLLEQDETVTDGCRGELVDILFAGIGRDHSGVDRGREI